MASPTSVAAAPRRGRVLLPTIIILGVIVLGFVIFTGFYTDWLWFDSVGKTEVFTVTLTTRLALFASFGLTMAVVLAGTLWIGYRFRPTIPLLTQEQAGLERYRMALNPYRVLITVGIAAVVGLLAGISASAEWGTFLRWRNATDFGVTDPQFGLDIGFYTFTYPFLRFVLGFAFSVVILAIGLAIAAHYLYGGLRLQPQGDRMSTAAQVHLSGLIALLLLLKAVAYWLDRYGLMVKSEALVQGFTGMKYTDVNAVLPALQILTFVALITAVLFIVNMIVRNWVIPLIGLGLLVLTSILVGGVYPAIVQQFQVRPSELVREQPYIERNITATRSAYDIADAQIQEYPGTVEPPTEAVIQANLGTLDNIRLLDPALASPTYNQLQQIRAYYSFNDSLDVDRYAMEGGQRGAVVAAREINLGGIPENQRNWANDHAVYTHGYGFVAAYDNTAESSGQPDFFESDIPPEGLLDIEQPRIYFGELSPTFSIVGAPEGTPPVELDYPDDASPTGQVNNTYTGSGGVPVGSFFNRLLFATKFQDSNILLTDLINEESRILWDRAPLERVEKIAPWLTLDQDPYPAVVDGRIVWLIDGYTTSNDYPYSSRVSLGEVTSDSITVRTGSTAIAPSDQLNYARNSVKAVVDAYEGTVTLYAWDEADPILQTWMKAFPGVVQERSAMPAEIEAHVRYPQDLFKVQRVVMSRYHVTDPATFYNGTDFWIVPFDPTQAIQQFQPPYYLTLQMPGQEQPTFSLTTTFAPQRRPTLAAFMAVDSAPGDGYGTIRVLQLPSNTTIPGPTQVQNNFESDPDISAELSLLRRGGSEVNLGNLLSLPFNGGLLYVEPVYLRATQDGYPLLRKVLAGYGANVALADTLDEALAAVFESDPIPTPEPTPGPDPDPNPDPTPTPTPTPTPGPSGDPLTDLQTALADAQAAYERGQAALADGDFAAYGEAQADLEAALRRAQEAEARLVGEDAGGQPA
ncbi:MAG: hypothetical protein RL134_604 [Actinomycetota bacterium]|jgi:uncharacterized membrane protein (UPF0182 family)